MRTTPAAALILVLAAGCGRPGEPPAVEMAAPREAEMSPMTPSAPARALPPIDLAVPAKLETATFAVG